MSERKKKGGKKSKIKTVVPPTPDEPYEEPPPKPLSDVPIYFWSTLGEEEKQSPTVPPPTPAYVTDVICGPSRIPTEFPPLTSFELPYVKEVGVKKCIEILGEFLGCPNFAFDYLQFWFLDMLTDCLWKTQDEYNLRDKEQKIVLEWVLYFFKVMTDPKLSHSRKTLFTIFKEAILLAGDVITEGVADVPLPHNLFTLVLEVEEGDEVETSEEDTDESSSSSAVSTISVSTFKSENVIEMQFDGQTKEYVVSKGLGSDSSTSSGSPDDTTTFTTSTKSAKQNSSTNQVDEEKEEVFEPIQYKDYKEFYQPDREIPRRFLPLLEEHEGRAAWEESTSSSSSESESECDADEDEGEEESSEKSSYVTDFNYLERVPLKETCEEKKDGEETQATVQNEKKASADRDQKQIRGNMEDQQSATLPIGSIKSRKVWIDQDQNSLELELTDSQILEKLAQYKLWEQRLRDMDDSRTGWVPVEESVEQIGPDKVKSEDFCADEDFNDLIPEVESEDFKRDNRRLISMGVLCAIIDLVFEYFYQSFHFTLIKLATLATPDTITQALNAEWKVPKANKEELQKPKPPKKKKKKKPKKPKKGKKKKSKKSSRKSKGKGKKKGKKGKKSKKSSKKAKKPKKLTKEEKAELERQRRLQEELEEERRRLEENKRFMFPLKDAATDELFMGIFENWVKPVEKKGKGKKGKKEKKGKGKGKKKKMM